MADVSVRTATKRRHAARWLRGQGIEIGALHNPLPLDPGVTVRYVDRLSNDQLREQYPELANEDLVHVDVIGDAQDLSAFADESLDFVIANHLVEHLEDPIRGLLEMFRVLRGGGVLFLAIPDPRNTFDHTRSLTPIDHVVDEFHNGTAQTRRNHFADWVAHVAAAEPDGPRTAAARAALVRRLMKMDYSIHFHVWRPDTFLEVLLAARREAGLVFQVGEVLSCDEEDDNEFVFVLLKGEFGSAAGRACLDGGCGDSAAASGAQPGCARARRGAPTRGSGPGTARRRATPAADAVRVTQLARHAPAPLGRAPWPGLV